MDSKKKAPRTKVKQEEVKTMLKKPIKPKNEQLSSGPPTRSLSSYLLYSKEVRPQVIKELPDAKPKDIMRAMGKKWSSLNEEQKKPYEELAAKDKDRYERQIEEYEREGRYYDDHGDVVVDEKRATKRKAQPMSKDKSSDEESEPEKKDKKPAKKKPVPMKKKKY